MSFTEKSAWVMGVIMLAVGAYYVKLVAVDDLAPIAAAIPFVLFGVIFSIVAQVILAVVYRREAVNAADERERIVADKAAHFSSYVLASGVVIGLGSFMLTQDGATMFHLILICLILGQISEYAATIFLLRKSV